MLRHRFMLLASPLPGLELAGLLFADYLQSSLFTTDVTEALTDVNGWLLFFRSGFSPAPLLHFYSRLISERLLYRVLECGVSAACTCSRLEICKDALAFHYVYSVVCEYRYARLWSTRLLRFVGRLFIPNFLRRSGSGSGGGAGHASVGHGRRSSSSISSPKRKVEEGSSKRFSPSSMVDPDITFFYNPPRPSRTAPFEGMPASCQDALRYYVYSYQTRPFYTTLVSGLITDAALFVADQCVWCMYFYQERKRRTSRWRLLKPYLSDLVVVASQTVLMYGARACGVCVGKALSQEPTGGGIFWGERCTLLVLLPGIQYASFFLGRQVRDALERHHPRTVDDEIEDKRLEEEAEAEARTASAFASATQDFGHGFATGGPSGSSGAGSPSRGTGGASLYEVLGVTEQAKAPEIKKAYRAMALRNHPDRVGKDAVAQENARQHMAHINEAYDTLVDPDKRAQYDAARRFTEDSAFFKRLETMSAVQLAAVGTAAVVGLGVLSVASAYGQYVALFHRMTSLGRGPLLLFS